MFTRDKSCHIQAIQIRNLPKNRIADRSACKRDVSAIDYIGAVMKGLWQLLVN
jgi:hypothetical protein